MATFKFQLKGLQLFSLVALWVVMSAGLFLLGAMVGYRGAGDDETLPEAAPVEEKLKKPTVPKPAASPATSAVGFDENLDLVFRSRTEIPETPFGAEIHRAASDHKVNPALVAAIVWIESEFDPRAVSHKGAIGLMQLMPQTAERFGYESGSMTDPAQNLAAGSQYLHWLAKRYSGDLALILGGYNAGEGAVDRYGGIPPYPETRQYVRKVLAAFHSLDDSAISAAGAAG